jgi:ABC-2 type transport system ATP-binding protein
VSVIEVEALEKTFIRGFLRRRTVALRGISFAVERGEVFGFLGPNGAGKTTTIKILMGLIFPSGGRARVLGAPLGARRMKARVGYLPENPYFYDYLSLRELLDMVGRIHGLDRATRCRRAAELSARVGLSHAVGRRLRSFSKGMLQRAGLAQALMGDPEVVVLDEPMSGLDPIGRREVRELMLELRARGKTVFFSTHILSDATLMCDRVAIIVRGDLRDVGPLGELLSPRLDSVDVVWEAPPEGAVEDLLSFAGEHSATSEGRVLRSRDPDVTARFLAAVVQRGGHILQVTPHRQTLEELFVTEATRIADRGDVEVEAS